MDWSTQPANRLIQACANGTGRGVWEEFLRRYHTCVVGAAARVSRRWGSGTADEIDDVVQEIYLKLFAERHRTLGRFHSTDDTAFLTLVKVIATNTARDYYRRKHAERRGASQTTTLAEPPAHIGVQPEQEMHATYADIDRLLRAITQGENGVRDRAIFYFYYRDGMTARAIASLPGVGLSAKGIEGVLHRLKTSIRGMAQETRSE